MHGTGFIRCAFSDRDYGFSCQQYIYVYNALLGARLKTLVPIRQSVRIFSTAPSFQWRLSTFIHHPLDWNITRNQVTKKFSFLVLLREKAKERKDGVCLFSLQGREDKGEHPEKAKEIRVGVLISPIFL